MKKYGKFLAGSLVISAALLPLQGNANVVGFTQLPAVEAHLDATPAKADTRAANDYSSMTKKDCAALKNHQDEYSDAEYKGRAKYCKSLKKHHVAKVKKNTSQTQAGSASTSGNSSPQ